MAPPMNHLTIGNHTIDLQALKVTGGPLQQIDHPLVRPDFVAPRLPHILVVEEVIAMHVGDEDRVDGLDAEPLAGRVEHAIEMLAIEEAAVDQQRMAGAASFTGP